MMGRKLPHVADGDMGDEEAARFAALEEQAERDATREIQELRVNLRWSRDHVELIRRAAAVYGITYQTYLKQAAVRQALADLKAAQEAYPRLVSPAQNEPDPPPRPRVSAGPGHDAG
jgi:predicted DNA binding CopG/RHH family protein